MLCTHLASGKNFILSPGGHLSNISAKRPHIQGGEKEYQEAMLQVHRRQETSEALLETQRRMEKEMQQI